MLWPALNLIGFTVLMGVVAVGPLLTNRYERERADSTLSAWHSILHAGRSMSLPRLT